jgi:hypothetical protein
MAAKAMTNNQVICILTLKTRVLVSVVQFKVCHHQNHLINYKFNAN